MPVSEVRVGVTGHRRLGGRDAEIAQIVGGLLDDIRRQLLPPEGTEPVTVVSPLADGADRIVAHAALERGMHLDVLLPLELHDYRTDFETAASRDEFDELLSRADHITTLPPAETRNDAYHAVGVAVLDSSTALIAMWDGNEAAGRGGTAEIVELARERGMPVAWIHIDQQAQARASSEPLVVTPLIVTKERWPWPS